MCWAVAIPEKPARPPLGASFDGVLFLAQELDVGAAGCCWLGPDAPGSSMWQPGLKKGAGLLVWFEV